MAMQPGVCHLRVGVSWTGRNTPHPSGGETELTLDATYPNRKNNLFINKRIPPAKSFNNTKLDETVGPVLLFHFSHYFFQAESPDLHEKIPITKPRSGARLAVP